MATVADDPRFRRYLLGQLPEEQASAVEREYFGDGEALERVWGAENDLVDDYVAGVLGPEDRAAFEGHYLASALHRDRVADARALRLAAARADARSPASRRPWLPVAAALLLAVPLLWWIARPRRPVRETAVAPPPAPASVGPPASPVARPSPVAPSISPAGRTQVVAAFALSPVLLRGGQGTPELRLPAGADEVALRLEGPLPEGVGSGARLSFSVETVEGDPVASGRTLTSAGSIGTARVPAARLPPGDYLLSVFPPERGGGGALHRYYFRILAE